MTQLTPSILGQATDWLSAADRQLAQVVASFGPPPLWARRPGFATLIRIVLEQQVSLRSARAAYARLQGGLGRVTPASVAARSLRDLRSLGLTQQKAGYCLGIAHDVLEGRLNLSAVARSDDRTAKEQLVAVRGVGPWTADIYLLMALRRPDVWPASDLALAVGVRRLKRLRRRPSDTQLQALASAWSPWRAVAARIVWHYYLQARRAS